MPLKIAERRIGPLRNTKLDKGEKNGLWSALWGARLESTLPEAVRLTMPENAIVLLRNPSGVPAGYAYGAIEEAWRRLDRSEVSQDWLVRRAVEHGWAEFEKRRRAANELRQGFGWDESQSWETMIDVEEKDAQAMPLILRIAKLAGRLYDSFQYHRLPRETAEPQVVKAVKVGGNVERLIPSELAQLGDPDLEDSATMRVLEGRALEYEMRGWSFRTRGPIVIVQDESGSMGGQRNEWAKACAVALARIAHQERRAVSVVHFAHSVVVSRVPANDPLAMYRMARHFLNGGTDIAAGLQCGLDEVEALAKKGHTGADMILISDGDDGSELEQERILTEAEVKQQSRLWTIAIDCKYEASHPCRKHAHYYQYLKDGQLMTADLSKLGGAALAREAKRVA
jgi:uncharacterized protein with von Willebrand factor type A (vWA) domain